MSIGHIVRVAGSVVDVAFEKGQLPRLREALRVQVDGETRVMEVARHIEGDAVIAAPGHEVSTEWGYVFRDCTVKPGTYAETTPDKSYSLGRP